MLHSEVVSRARAALNVVGIRLYVERSNQRAQQTYRTLGMVETHYQMFEQPFVALP
jgi:ribosomal protein S18 acetylase RimI-like enzyme